MGTEKKANCKIPKTIFPNIKIRTKLKQTTEIGLNANPTQKENLNPENSKCLNS